MKNPSSIQIKEAGSGIPEAPSDSKQYARKNAAWAEVAAGSAPKTFGITVDGAGQVLTTGSKGFVTIPYDCTITDWYLAADQSGSIQFLVKNNGDVITSEGDNPLIKLTASQSGNGGSEAWTFPIIAAGDILEFEIPGTPATITRVNLVIKAI